MPYLAICIPCLTVASSHSLLYARWSFRDDDGDDDDDNDDDDDDDDSTTQHFDDDDDDGGGGSAPSINIDQGMK